MRNDLLPPSNLAPPTLAELTPAERVQVWADLIDANHQLLMAGLRREIGKDGDLVAALRAWDRRQKESHDRTMRHLVDQFNRRWSDHGSEPPT